MFRIAEVFGNLSSGVGNIYQQAFGHSTKLNNEIQQFIDGFEVRSDSPIVLTVQIEATWKRLESSVECFRSSERSQNDGRRL